MMSDPTYSPTAEIDTELASTCAHELGHAIVMRELGLTPAIVRVHPFWGGGYCQTEERIETWQQYAHCGVIALAGWEGENHWRMLRGLSGASTWGASSDTSYFRRALRDIKQYSEGEVTLKEHQARAEAMEILLAHWEELEGLIPELADRTKIKDLGSRP
jgi:hypothetical protein